jgi:hypothetical protein
MFMQFTGRPLISATNYEQEVLRCAKCQDRFVAPLPEGISDERYDPTCDANSCAAEVWCGFALVSSGTITGR